MQNRNETKTPSQQAGQPSKESETRKYARPDENVSKERKDGKTGSSGCGC